MTDDNPALPPVDGSGVVGGIHPTDPWPMALRRLSLVVTQPTTAFRGLGNDRTSWLLPALLVSLLAAVSPILMSTLHVEKQMAAVEQMVDRGIITEEMAAEIQQKTAERASNRALGPTLFQVLLGVLSHLAFRYLLPAALLLAGVRFVMEGRATFPAVLSVVAFSSVPAGIRELVRTPLQLAEGTLEIQFSPALLAGGSQNLGAYALNLLDFFDIWILALLILGLAAVGPISRGRAAGLVLPLWLIYSLAKIGLKASPFGAAL
ncbi:MAG: YIP1 family protein [Candidatus Eisenbacteria sp.]|nr:YIP1 family protein [Candidatus Eisenbacteria bacterium]